jgi:putative component of membrane protein insertase Oxa1/YidC/SpoIIIJ protein YidD
MQEIACCGTNSGAEIAREFVARVSRTVDLGFADEHIAKAIGEAQTSAVLDALMRLVWRGLADGAINDDEAEELSSRIDARRQPHPRRLKREGSAARRTSIFSARRPQPSRRTAASLARRRQLVAAGPMPPRLAQHFTPAELAALMIMREEIRLHGTCSSYIAEIAARAGVGRTSVQNAMRRGRARPDHYSGTPAPRAKEPHERDPDHQPRVVGVDRQLEGGEERQPDRVQKREPHGQRKNNRLSDKAWAGG